MCGYVCLCIMCACVRVYVCEAHIERSNRSRSRLGRAVDKARMLFSRSCSSRRQSSDKARGLRVLVILVFVSRTKKHLYRRRCSEAPLTLMDKGAVKHSWGIPWNSSASKHPLIRGAMRHLRSSTILQNAKALVRQGFVIAQSGCKPGSFPKRSWTFERCINVPLTTVNANCLQSLLHRSHLLQTL